MTGIANTHRMARLYNHITRESLVFPTLAVGAPVVSSAANWTYGVYATVMAATTILAPFHIHAVSIESCDQNAVFQLQLYQSAADTVVSTVRFAVAGGFFGNQVYPIGSALIPANARIRARLASSDGLANQATISISFVYVIE